MGGGISIDACLVVTRRPPWLLSYFVCGMRSSLLWASSPIGMYNNIYIICMTKTIYLQRACYDVR